LDIDERIIIDLKGNFNHNTVLKVINILEKNNNLDIISDSEIKKLLNISIELIENNNKYIDSLNSEIIYKSEPSKFKIVKTKNEIIIESGNTILAEDESKLKEKYEYINTLDTKQVKKEYLNAIIDSVNKKDRDFGAGILRVARISNSKFEYSFKQINNKLVYFNVKLKVCIS